ncbi:group III truncated hemoglobin [Arthrobacter sp. TMN-49]
MAGIPIALAVTGRATMGSQAPNSGRTTSNLHAYTASEVPEPVVQLPDIANRADILELVETFYTKAFADDLLGPIFTEVAHLDLDLAEHLPIMADFWQTVLFKAGLYKRNALNIHFDVDAKEPLTGEHFNRWLTLWSSTVDMLFAGEKAELAKAQAHVIAGSMHRRVTGRPASSLGTITQRPG